jgi:hypothetical protein
MQGICKYADGVNCETVNFKDGSNVSITGGMLNKKIQVMCHNFSADSLKESTASDSAAASSTTTQNMMYGAAAVVVLIIIVSMYRRPVV